MNCEGCEALLVDLLYDELRAPEAKEAEAHLKDCASCKASFDRLGGARRIAAHLPLEEPSAAVIERIMGAARSHVQMSSRERERSAATWWDSFLQSLRSFAVGPQVAMATLMLLVVGIGLWYLPQARRDSSPTAGTVVNPDHAGEAAPSEAAPALDLDFNPRTGRIRVRDEAQGAPNAPAELRAQAPSGVADQGQAWKGNKPQDELAAAPSAAELGEGGDMGSERNYAVATRGRAARRGGYAADDSLAGGRMDDPSAGVDGLRAEGGAGRGVGGSFPAEPSLEEEAQASRQQPDRDRFAVAPPAARPAQVATAEARERASAGDVSSEAATVPTRRAPAGPPTPATEAAAPSATASPIAGATGSANTAAPAPSANELLASARAFRARGECGAAVQRYETLFTRFPNASTTPTARIEAAQCYEQLRQYTRARVHLDRAAQDSRSAPAARRAIERLEATRRSNATSAE